MKARVGLVLGLAALAACPVGPNYEPQPPVPPATKVGTPRGPDSIAMFFDSLAAARVADSVATLRVATAHTVLATQIADLAWLDILNDSTLLRLVETAVRQNKDLAVARARIEEFRAEKGIAASPLYPSLTLNASASTNRIALPNIQYEAYRVTGDVAWELDFWGKTRRGIQAANADLEAQDAAARAAVLSLVSDVASGYLTLLELDQERAISEATLASRRSTLDLARQRYASGVTSEIDVRAFEAQVTVPAVRLAQIQALRAQQEHALSVLLGDASVTIPQGGSLSTAARAVIIPDSLPSTLLSRRPDVKVAERQYAAAMARIGVADAARYPAVSIVAFYGTQSTTVGQIFAPGNNVYTLQGGLSFPIFAGGALSEEVRAARARAQQAQAVYEQVSLTALQEAGDALAGVRSAHEQVAAQETQTVALRRALVLAQDRYQGGVSGFLEVLEAQRGLFDAEVALSQSQLQQMVAAVHLYKALGGSWAELSKGASSR
jgi:multidrug efflux system outer membrane protein